MRIFLKLTSLIVVTALITLAGILFVTWKDNSATLKAQALYRLMELATHTMDKMDRYLSERKGDLVVIATDPVISSRDSTMEEVTERLRSFKDIYGRYNSLSFFSLDGVRLADTEGLGVGQRQSAFKGWGGVREGHPSAAEEVGFSETLKEPVVFFASLVRDKAGDAIGFVVTRVPISGLYEILGDVSSSPFGGLG
ncbi:MAG TPA: cache domain-containing protein, partial [Candidatus Omnitrophota bacterium]|nr:cache domain-containing protein [Candidatus Omnitrophota bacterium]